MQREDIPSDREALLAGDIFKAGHIGAGVARRRGWRHEGVGGDVPATNQRPLRRVAAVRD